MFIRLLGFLMVMGALLTGRCIGGETATAVATVTAGFVTSITVTSGGSGYTTAPTVRISGGGGNGATAAAVLEGDRVALVVVLTAGSGYTSSPIITIEDPSPSLGLDIALVAKLTVGGPEGMDANIERSDYADGPWVVWTNVVVNADGTVLVDLEPGSSIRFYRATTFPNPAVPMVWVEPGSFSMGSPSNETGRSAEEVLHQVTLTKGFYIGETEVTQGQYLEVVGSNPSHFTGNPNMPVEQVNWFEATNYCRLLTVRERTARRLPNNWEYRLPTEAEWEYACRAGSSAPFGIGNGYDLSSFEANFNGNYPYGAGAVGPHLQRNVPVASYEPNDWGIYDMHGNVFELCSDWYGAYPSGAVTDPAGPVSGSYRVGRGGGWNGDAKGCRSAYRLWFHLDLKRDDIGFRVVLAEVP